MAAEVRAMPVSVVTTKGRVTIPREIRRLLRLKPGDRIEFVVEAGGMVVLVPATVPVSELEGLLAPAPRKVPLKDMDAAIRERAGR